LHDHVPFGCADAPVPFSAAPLQVHFKDWKSTIWHLKDWKLTIRHGNLDKRTSSAKHYTSGRWECHRIFAPGTAANLTPQQPWRPDVADRGNRRMATIGGRHGDVPAGNVEGFMLSGVRPARRWE
jgi:hypothetical protein